MGLDQPQKGAPKAGESDPADDDPLAQRIAWTPLSTGSVNLVTHRLHRIDSGHVEFQPVLLSAVARAALPILLMTAGALLVVALEEASHLPICLEVALTITLSTFLIVAIVGRVCLRSPQFDLTKGTFMGDRSHAEWRRNRRGQPVPIALAHVRALQLLAKADDEYRSYELNLVMDDASRVAVLAHCGGMVMRSEAMELARLLDVPVWDRTR